MDALPTARDENPTDRTPARPMSSLRATDLSAYGEPYLWGLGGALALGNGLPGLVRSAVARVSSDSSTG